MRRAKLTNTQLVSPFRYGDHWLVSAKEKNVLLRAPVGQDPNQPPTTGWQFGKEVIFKKGTD